MSDELNAIASSLRSSSMAHTLQRHQDILQDYRQEFKKTKVIQAQMAPRIANQLSCFSNLVHWRKRSNFLYTFWKWERARAGIEPMAAAPSQPDCPGVSCSDHSAGSKESASWRALGLHSDWHGRLGGWKREKEGKETSRRGSQDEPAQDKEENGSWTNSAKR